MDFYFSLSLPSVFILIPYHPGNLSTYIPKTPNAVASAFWIQVGFPHIFGQLIFTHKNWTYQQCLFKNVLYL